MPSGWIWTKESQREIQKVKAQYDKDVSTIKNEMEVKYRETLTERRRAAATLELELEKERQRVKGYKLALVSQSQQLMEERKQLQQVKSRVIVHLSPLRCSLSCINQTLTSFTRSRKPWRTRSTGW